MMDTRWQLVAYVFASIILRMVGAQLCRRRTDLAWVRFLSEGRAVSVLRFVYYIGLPYIALILGVVPGRYLGLVGLGQAQEIPVELDSGFFARIRDYLSLVILNWLPNVGTVVALGAVTVLFLGITWLGYAFFRGRLTSGSGVSPSPPRQGNSLRLIHIIYQAVHWSFYRSVVWLLTGDLYLGVFGGIILVVGEWILDAGWMQSVRRVDSIEVPLIDASVLVATSLLFFFVPILWLLIPVHWLLAAVSRRVVLGQGRISDGPSEDFVYQVPW